MPNEEGVGTAYRQDPPAIEACPVGVAAFVGRFERGPENVPVAVTSPEELEREFGGVLHDGDTGLAARMFFLNGGLRAHVVRVVATPGETVGAVLGSAADGTGLHALRQVDEVELVCLPDVARLPPEEAGAAYAAAIELCSEQRWFLLVDAPWSGDDPQQLVTWVEDHGLRHEDAALYVPRVSVTDRPEEGTSRAIGPSGAIAGVYARTDSSRGVWKAPAGTEATLNGLLGLETLLGPTEQEQLNPAGINMLRRLPQHGDVVWGGRTLAGAGAGPGAALEWRYVPVRRTAQFARRSLERGLAWVLTEANTEVLWSRVRSTVTAFLTDLWRSGGLQGTTADHAFFVRCAAGSTMTPDDLAEGVLRVEVGLALVRPSEFVVLRLRFDLFTGQEEASEIDLTVEEDRLPAHASPLDESAVEALLQLGLSREAVEVLQGLLREQDRRRRTGSAVRRHLERPPAGDDLATADRGATLAVFSGPAGPRKLQAARVLADQVGVELMRIDLTAVVSRYIGETEKNLRRVFDVAALAGAVLMFDEADALFGRARDADAAGTGEPVDLGPLRASLATHPWLVIVVAEHAADAVARSLKPQAIVAFPRDASSGPWRIRNGDDRKVVRIRRGLGAD